MLQIINVEKSSVAMLQTKVEVKLKKAEPGSWAKLDFPRVVQQEEKKVEVVKPVREPSLDDEPVDLADIY